MIICHPLIQADHHHPSRKPIGTMDFCIKYISKMLTCFGLVCHPDPLRLHMTSTISQTVKHCPTYFPESICG